MIRRSVLPLLAVLGVGLAIAMVFRGNQTAATAQTAVPSATPPFTSYIFGPGVVEASTENIAVGTPASGIVTSMYVNWGDRVERGAPLFTVDTRDLEAQRLPATAKVTEVEAQLAAATASVREARATLAKAQNRLTVGEGLEPGVSISAEDLANRRFDVGAGQAALAAADANVEHVKAQVASANAQVQQIAREIEIRTVRAPVAGRVLQMKVRLGEYAQTGVLSTPLMILGDDTTLHVRVDIDDADAWRFRSCAPAVAWVRGNPVLKTPLRYVRTDPDVIPKVTLTGDATQRTDTRVLQVIYSFESASLPAYVGQLLDVFIRAAPSGATSGTPSRADPCRDGPKTPTAPTVDGRRP